MANADPVALGSGVHYLPGSVNTAIVEGDDGQAILVDTGQDRDYGKRLKDACAALGLRPVAILNTHAHADHFGANAYLLRAFDVVVYAPELEASLMASPDLEPIYLFHGARPLAELTSKWLRAPSSPVHHLVRPGPLEIAGRTLRLIDTSGHAHRQVSVEVDDVLLAADAVFGEAVLTRYPLPFGQDVAGQLASLERLEALEVRVALPGHGAPTHDLGELTRRNRTVMELAAEAVLASAGDASTDEVMRGVCGRLGIELNDLPRYYLTLCTVAAYLGHLRTLGHLDVRLEHNQVRWSRR